MPPAWMTCMPPVTKPLALTVPRRTPTPLRRPPHPGNNPTAAVHADVALERRVAGDVAGGPGQGDLGREEERGRLLRRGMSRGRVDSALRRQRRVDGRVPAPARTYRRRALPRRRAHLRVVPSHWPQARELKRCGLRRCGRRREADAASDDAHRWVLHRLGRAHHGDTKQQRQREGMQAAAAAAAVAAAAAAATTTNTTTTTNITTSQAAASSSSLSSSASSLPVSFLLALHLSQHAWRTAATRHPLYPPSRHHHTTTTTTTATTTATIATITTSDHSGLVQSEAAADIRSD